MKKKGRSPRGRRLIEKREADVAESDLYFRGAKEQVVRRLARTCNDYAHAVFMTEKAFYEKYGLNVLRNLYSELEGTLIALPEGDFLLNIGWRSGWGVKTVGELLRMALGRDEFIRLRLP